MALRGNLQDFSLPDVFQLVTLSGKTGVLRIRRSGATGSVWFRGGEVFFAESDWQSEPLGERLVTAGRITPSALSRALEVQRQEPHSGRRLGEILIAEGYVSDKVLEAFVQEQIQDTIFDLFRWAEGDFDFELLEEAPAEDIGLSVSIENIVMEGSRRLEEWNRIKKKIPSTDIVFKMATAPGEGTFDISLKPTEWNLLLTVDGTRSVAELARELGRTDFEVARVIYGLFSAGLLEVATDDEVERLRAERAAWEARLAEENAVRQAEREAAAATAAAAPPEPAVAAATPVAPVAPGPSAEAQPEAAVPADHEVEEPAYLTAVAPTPDDMAVFERMMDAVLEIPPAAEPPAEELPAAEPPAAEPPAEEPSAEEAPAEELPAAELPAEEVPAEEPPAEEAVPEEPYVEEVVEPADLLETLRYDEPPLDLLEALPPESETYVPEEEYGIGSGEAPVPVDALLTPADVETTELPDAMIFDGSEDVAEEAQPIMELLAALDGSQPSEDIADQTAAQRPVRTGDFAADLMALGLGELPTDEELLAVEAASEPVEGSALAGSADVVAASELADLLSSLEIDETVGEAYPAVLQTPDPGLDTDTDTETDIVLSEEAPASGVISTDAFLADFDAGDGSYSSGLGNELTALTGGGTARTRPQATVARLAPEGEHVLHRDRHVDRALVERIIEGVKKL